MNFIIAAPPYSHRSGGIRVLHELCTALIQLGYQASIAFITEGSQLSQGFKFAYSTDKNLHDPNGLYYDYFSNRTTQEVNDYINNSCIIYPDIVKGNPLSGKFFVTYVLGRPEFSIFSDYILSFSKLYIDKSDFVLHKSFFDHCMNDSETLHWSNRTLSLTYIGKGSNYLDCNIIPGTILIERDWPKDKNQLSIILKNCKYFYSWDCVSATNTDAILCGAVPILMHDLQIHRDILNTSELGSFPPIKYEDAASNNQLKINIDEIDSHLLMFKNKFLYYHSAWTSNVELFVESVINKFSKHPSNLI